MIHQCVGKQSSSSSSSSTSVTQFLLTDQPEAMELLNENVRYNSHFYRCVRAGNNNSSSGGSGGGDDVGNERSSVCVATSTLMWGSEADHAALTIPGPFDVIIASDVIFNPIYFAQLIQVKYIYHLCFFVFHSHNFFVAAAASAARSLIRWSLVQTLHLLTTVGSIIFLAYRPRINFEVQDKVNSHTFGWWVCFFFFLFSAS
jgi:hypothetical protein